jgi:hypothetical protein
MIRTAPVERAIGRRGGALSTSSASRDPDGFIAGLKR